MIKQKWLAAISVICLALAAWLGIERTLFVMRAVETEGIVVNVEGYNARCGGRRWRYACTKFTARVEYRDGRRGDTLAIKVSAGRSRGQNQPIASASVKEGDAVEVIYSPDDATDAYRNTILDVWILPLSALFVHVSTLIGSLSEGRARRRRA